MAITKNNETAYSLAENLIDDKIKKLDQICTNMKNNISLFDRFVKSMKIRGDIDYSQKADFRISMIYEDLDVINKLTDSIKTDIITLKRKGWVLREEYNSILSGYDSANKSMILNEVLALNFELDRMKKDSAYDAFNSTVLLSVIDCIKISQDHIFSTLDRFLTVTTKIQNEHVSYLSFFEISNTFNDVP